MTLNFAFNAAFFLLFGASLILVFHEARKFSFRKLHKDRRGVSYSLTMLITVPFYVAMVLGGIELTWLFYANLRFQRATMMVGRAVAVCYQQEFEKHDQDPARTKKSVEQIGELSGAAVLFPAGSGLEEHRVPLTEDETRFINQLLAHFDSTTEFSSNDDTGRRASYAAGATKVEFELLPKKNNTNGTGWPDRATVKVTYEHPFFSQAIGRVFGQPSSVGSGFYVRELQEIFEIPLEIARSKDGTMGIK